VIFHITGRAEWEGARQAGVYAVSTRGKTLVGVGFIHCAFREQVPGVAELVFADADDLVLLSIDEAALNAEVRTENLDGGSELFPHIYGPLNLDAVAYVDTFERGADGRFVLPKRWRNG
jgi:glutathione S-transferase